MSSLATVSTRQFLGKLLRYGQYPIVYPSAFLDRPRIVMFPIHTSRYDLVLPTPDGETLCCYLLPAMASLLHPGYLNNRNEFSRSYATVILFHGNSKNIGDYVWPAHQLCRKDYNVLIVSYRGYAHSSGLPSEKGLRIDAQTVLDYVTTHPILSRLQIILYGHGLGGAVAIDLASQNPSKIHALIVENTFTSIPDIVRDWPIIGRLAFLCHQKWNSASKIQLIPVSIPILMMSSSGDQFIPPKHMDTLWTLSATRGSHKGQNDHQSPVIPMSTKDKFHRILDGSHFSMLSRGDLGGVLWDFLSSLRDTAAHDMNVSEDHMQSLEITNRDCAPLDLQE